MQFQEITKDGTLKDLNKEVSEKRMKICRACPLYTIKFGGTCNSKLYLNPNTGEVSPFPKNGFIKGCGCVLQKKTLDPIGGCPAGKW